MMITKNTLFCGNCIQIMRGIADQSVDMIFADPPYFMQLNTPLYRPDTTRVYTVDDTWDKFGNFGHYDRFTLQWLSEAKRILKPTGTLWVIGSYHNIFRLGYWLQTLGFWILNDVVWHKTNPMPNFKGTRFSNAHETLIWCAKEQGARYTFNYESLKTFNDDLQMRSDWHLPICNGKERLKSKDGRRVHSTQKPLALLKRIILASSNTGDLILDPFFGTGTSGAAAKELGRRFIGIEQEADYVLPAYERISPLKPLPNTQSTPPEQSQTPRISFGMLLENGYLKPGDVLTDKKRRHRARVLADGSVQIGRVKLSIHKMAARCQNSSSQSANGWIYWHAFNNNALCPLDELRNRLKEKLFPEKEADSFFVENTDDLP